MLAGGLRVLEGKRGSVWVALWIAVGLHSHYYFFHYLFLMGIAAMVAAGKWPDLRKPVLRLALAALIGLLKDEEGRKRMGAAGRARARRYDWGKVARSFVQSVS